MKKDEGWEEKELEKEEQKKEGRRWKDKEEGWIERKRMNDESMQREDRDGGW